MTRRSCGRVTALIRLKGNINANGALPGEYLQRGEAESPPASTPLLSLGGLIPEGKRVGVPAIFRFEEITMKALIRLDSGCKAPCPVHAGE